MGLVDRTHEAMYQAIHIERTLKGERGRDSVEDIAAFYGKFGVDPKQFASTMSSFAVNAKAARAKQFAMRSQITGTPSLARSEEHTSELQSLMRISYAVF